MKVGLEIFAEAAKNGCAVRWPDGKVEQLSVQDNGMTMVLCGTGLDGKLHQLPLQEVYDCEIVDEWP